jgi:DMSO/TMAO reductase YedYZ molybdopterin-dependent catalytic subunit
MKEHPEIAKLLERRRFVQLAAAGTFVTAFGGLGLISDELTRMARAETRPDGRPRLPPGQRVIQRLKPMGGDPGDPSAGAFRLRVHGHVESPFEIDFRELLKLKNVTLAVDVHCVTAWSVLGAKLTGVRVRDLLARAAPKKGARYVVFEAAHGYTANLPLREARKENALIAHRLDGRGLPRPHGGPVRAVMPDLYFWKSAKWITGIRVLTRDAPGYWETRGYHNHADPWKEQRHS